MEKKVIIPEGFELVKVSESEYKIQKKAPERPKTWKEFCKNYPIKETEAFIDIDSSILNSCYIMDFARDNTDKNLCVNNQEAEAFLALMQLRQLRKAWVGDWKPNGKANFFAINWDLWENALKTKLFIYNNKVLSFPTLTMAEEFLECFKDLCETAKILL